MADPQDFQFELGGVLFGLDCDVAVEANGFDQGSVTWNTQDAESSLDDVVYMGRDVAVPSTWAWTCFTSITDPVDREAVAKALDAVDALQAVWEDDRIRSTPGAFATLRYKRPGAGVRRIYGRPRRFAPKLDNLLLNGRIDLTMDFRRVDRLHYDDAAESQTIGTLAGNVGGFTVPATIPWGSAASNDPQARFITVGGTAPTWPIVTFTGQQQSPPWLDIDGWRCALQVTMAPTDVIVVDTRPWVRTVKRNGVVTPGLLSPATRLRKASLRPGVHEATFGAFDPTNNATVTVAWRNAYRTL